MWYPLSDNTVLEIGQRNLDGPITRTIGAFSSSPTVLKIGHM